MNCWYCKAPLSSLSFGKISFRAICDRCDHDLHCCKNCKYYKPGMANECSVPGTEWVSDREKNNLCEEFSLFTKGCEMKGCEMKADDAKKRFEDLFR